MFLRLFVRPIVRPPIYGKFRRVLARHLQRLLVVYLFRVLFRRKFLLFFLVVARGLPKGVQLMFHVRLLYGRRSPRGFFLFNVGRVVVQFFPGVKGGVQGFLQYRYHAFLRVQSNVRRKVRPMQSAISVSLTFPVFGRGNVFPTRGKRMNASICGQGSLQVFRLLLMCGHTSRVQLRGCRLVHGRGVKGAFYGFFVRRPRFRRILVGRHRVVIRVFLLSLFRNGATRRPTVLFVGFQFTFL